MLRATRLRILQNLFIAFTLLDARVTLAELKLPAIISDHMVLQADAEVPVWGKATPGAAVVVAFNGQHLSTVANTEGFWQVRLKPMKPAASELDMSIQEANNSPRVIKDILVGEVWLASGQSNMAYPLSSMDGKDEYITKAANAQIRYFSVAKRVAPSPEGLRSGLADGDVQGRWVVSDAKSAADFSAVGVLFAEELQERLQHPVGMIGSYWGGTPIQLWMGLDAFSASPAIQEEITKYQTALAKHKQISADPHAEGDYKLVFDTWQNEVGKDHDAAMAIWNKANDAGKDAGPRPSLSKPEPRNPDPIGLTYGSERPATPSTGFNAMISPLAPFAIKGALWYQGEANVSHWQQYGDLLRALVVNWREHFANPDMSFYVVQLPANGKNKEPRDLPRLREAQASVLRLPHTALAVGFDVGSPGNVHPRSKVAISHRLTLDALGEAYGQKVPFRGPVLSSLSTKKNDLTLHFSDDGGGLIIGQAPWLAPDAVQYPSDHLVGFELAAKNGAFVPATAEIHGNDLVLHADGVTQPYAVRYAWDQSPQANLYDKAGLPAMPFRADVDSVSVALKR